MIKTISILVMVFSFIIPKSSNCQDMKAINDIGLRLKQGRTTITDVLSSDSFMHLHSITAFRNIIRENAKPGKFSMMSKTEAGTRVTIKALVTDKNGVPQKNLLIYVYQTSDKGWYSDTGAHILINSGDINHARLFAYLKTDDKGEFSYETVKPRGYPRSDLAAHIHIHFWSDTRTLRGPGELQFDDDDRMTPERRRRSLQDGYLVSKNSGTGQNPVYEYKIVVE